VIRSIGKNSLESIKLTARQRRAIPLVLAAKSIEEGCRLARITPVTWYAWLKNEGFKAVVEAQREAVVSEALNRLKAAVKGAVEGMTALMGAEEKNIRLRASRARPRILPQSKRTRGHRGAFGAARNTDRGEEGMSLSSNGLRPRDRHYRNAQRRLSGEKRQGKTRKA